MQYLRTTKVIKTGTSLCVVIPKEILVALKLERGDQVVFGIYDNSSLVVQKVTQQDLLNFNLASAGATAKH